MTYPVYGFAKFNEMLFKALMNDFSAVGTAIKCALFADTWTPAQETEDDYTDISAYEIDSGTYPGYTAGGVALANKAIAVATRTMSFDSDDPTWDAATITARRAAYYDDTDASPKPLVCYADFGENKSCSSGQFKLVHAATGLIRYTMPAAS